jgi:hypothetical protein
LNIDFSGAVYESRAERFATSGLAMPGKIGVMLDLVSSSTSGVADIQVIGPLTADAEQVTGEAWSTASAPPKHNSIFES